jgi:hypothetical protein
MQSDASSATLTYHVPWPARGCGRCLPCSGSYKNPRATGSALRAGCRRFIAYAAMSGETPCIPAAAGKIPQPFTDTTPCGKIPREPDGSSGSFSGIPGRPIGYPTMAQNSTTRTSVMITSPLRFMQRAAGAHDLQCRKNTEVREHCD